MSQTLIVSSCCCQRAPDCECIPETFSYDVQSSSRWRREIDGFVVEEIVESFDVQANFVRDGIVMKCVSASLFASFTTSNYVRKSFPIGSGNEGNCADIATGCAPPPGGCKEFVLCRTQTVSGSTSDPSLFSVICSDPCAPFNPSWVHWAIVIPGITMQGIEQTRDVCTGAGDVSKPISFGSSGRIIWSSAGCLTPSAFDQLAVSAWLYAPTGFSPCIRVRPDLVADCQNHANAPAILFPISAYNYSESTCPSLRCVDPQIWYDCDPFSQTYNQIIASCGCDDLDPTPPICGTAGLDLGTGGQGVVIEYVSENLAFSAA